MQPVRDQEINNAFAQQPKIAMQKQRFTEYFRYISRSIKDWGQLNNAAMSSIRL